jgi:hypothetical protein
MDCPPALNMLTVNGLVAADSRDDSDAVRVLRAGRPDRSRRDAEEGAANLNPVLEIEGLLRTMFDPRSTLTQQVSRELERALRQQGLSHHHPAQCTSGRGTVLRQAGDCLRPFVEGRAGVHGLLAQEILDRRRRGRVRPSALARSGA